MVLQDVSVRLDGKPVLRHVDLTAPDASFVGVVGASGCGKTTLLRVVAGLVPVADGRLRFDGGDVTTSPPAARDIGMVFQSPALLPRRNVHGNVAFPLEIRRQHASEIRRRVAAEVRALHIETLLNRMPDELSRGEEQMVQIARAMVRVPRVLLLDEPFSSLDPSLRHRLRGEIKLLQRGYGVTTIMATNDPEDALALPDVLVVLEDGRVVQVGDPMQVRRTPTSLTAALATGALSTLTVTATRDEHGFVLVAPSSDGPFRYRMSTPALADRLGDALLLGFRPEDVSVSADGELLVTVERVVPGSPPVVWCRVGGQRVVVAAPSVHPSLHVDAGDQLRLHVAHALAFDPTSGATIT